MENHTTYEQIAFMDRVISALRLGDKDRVIHDVVRPCLEWMGWKGNHDGSADEALRVPSGTTEKQTDHGSQFSAIINVHVGTRWVEFPIFVMKHEDHKNRFDVWSSSKGRKVEVDLKNPDTCLALTDMMRETIKSHL